MRLNLSSQIVLNKVPVEFYKPKTAVEYSEISRMEKIHTDIFASMTEGASHVADKIEAGIKAAQQEGKFYVMALGVGWVFQAFFFIVCFKMKRIVYVLLLFCFYFLFL